MYQIYCDDTLIYDVRLSDLTVTEATLSMELNSAGDLKFTLPTIHPYRDLPVEMTSVIKVLQDNKTIFIGRVYEKRIDIFKQATYSCEGALSYLADTVMRPFEYTGGIYDFFKKVIDNHNAQVENKKKFIIGEVTVVDSNNYINRSNQSHMNSLLTISEKLIDTHGGYLKVRYENDGMYLDYVSSYGKTNSQEIRFGENIKDIEQTIDPTEIITALIPLGASDDEGVPLDIKSVNNNLDYIYDQDAVSKYGWIWGTNIWPDVTVASNLLTKARAYLQQTISLPRTIDISAVDLSLVDSDLEPFHLGYDTLVKSSFNDVEATYVLNEMVIDLLDPANNQILLGKKRDTFSGSAAKHAVEIIDAYHNISSEMMSVIQAQTNLITGAKGGYVVINQSSTDGTPQEILIMDNPDKTKAKNVIRMNRNGIGFSTKGYNGPFDTAWTIDGKFNANYITAGTMSASRIKGGSLILGGNDNGFGELQIKDANGEVIGRWNKDGISATKGEFKSGLTINGSQITGGSLGYDKFSDGAKSSISSTAIDAANVKAKEVVADKIKALEITADKIVPDGDFVEFTRGPVLVQRLQIKDNSNITCGEGHCGEREWPFSEMWSRQYNNPSRRELKQDIEDLTNCLDIIKRTDPVKFRYKAYPEGRLRYGIISNDAPEELCTDERQGMDMGNCIGILIGAVKELEKEVEELKNGSN